MPRQLQERVGNVPPRWTLRVAGSHQLFSELLVISTRTHPFDYNPARHITLPLLTDTLTPVLRIKDDEGVAQVAHVTGTSLGHLKTAY